MPAAIACADVICELSSATACDTPNRAIRSFDDRQRHLIRIQQVRLQVRAARAVVARLRRSSRAGLRARRRSSRCRRSPAASRPCRSTSRRWCCSRRRDRCGAAADRRAILDPAGTSAVRPESVLENGYCPMKPAKWLLLWITVTRPNDRPTPPRTTVPLVGRVGEARARRPGAVVAGDQAARAGAAVAVTGEDQRAGIAVRRRIRLGRREVRILIAAGSRRTRVFVAHAVVDDQLAVHAPVVLRVEAVIRIDLLEIADGLGAARIRVAEQEGGERAAAGELRHARQPGLLEVESGAAAVVLLAEAVRLLAIEQEAALERVRAGEERRVVLDGQTRLLRAVVRRRAPGRKLRERDDRPCSDRSRPRWECTRATAQP